MSQKTHLPILNFKNFKNGPKNEFGQFHRVKIEFLSKLIGQTQNFNFSQNTIFKVVHITTFQRTF